MSKQIFEKLKTYILKFWKFLYLIITNKDLTIMLKVSFKNIPSESKLAIFDKANTSSVSTWVIEPGYTEIEFEIPNSWENPHKSLRTTGYFIPDSYAPIDRTKREIEITGGDYYVDVDRDVLNEELNQKSVETLIHSIFGNDGLDGRQKFFVSIISLQSYFEYLVYGMLVISGHMSKTQFNNLRTQSSRIPVAFSNQNTDFFSTQIEICPGKSGLGSDISQIIRDDSKNIFEEVGRIRNKVVHRWGYKDIGQHTLKDIFSSLREDINLNDSDDQFYSDACFVCVRLYARTSALGNQLSLFNEKEIVKAEREARGYN